MKNKIIDLNNHLFAQLERLSDESLKGSDLSEEIHRGKAIAMVAKEIIVAATLTLEAHKLYESREVNQVPIALRLPNLKDHLQ